MNTEVKHRTDSEAPVATVLADTQSLKKLFGAATVAVTLQGCGGSSDDVSTIGQGGTAVEGGAVVSEDDAPGPNQKSATPVEPGLMTRPRAARLLARAGFGGNAAEIENVRTLGYKGWLAQQFAMPQTQGRVDWMVANGYYFETADGSPDRPAAEHTIWRKLISGADVLRQRVTLALSEIFVISMIPVTLPYRGFATAAFMDLLEANAFGSYRDLLIGVSKSPAMGKYLSFMGNKKANGLGSSPDENYAREVMQLFSIGLVKLKLNGTPDLLNGELQPTYTQTDVTQLARVFTGWDASKGPTGSPKYYHVTTPMFNRESSHEPGASSFLDITVPAGTDGETSLKLAIDALMNHPSMAPFIGRQLIQRLVTSNPSPEYVERVATAFRGDGTAAGAGDMKATITAILLDEEARKREYRESPNRGKLREPMVRFIQWARTFGLTSTDNVWNINSLSSVVTGLGQSPIRSPSVFNFFRPGYIPPSSSLGNRGITAPEFQIANETTVCSYINFMQKVISGGIGGMSADYSALMPLVEHPHYLVS